MNPKIIYKNVKHLRLKISPDGLLTAIAPTGMSEEQVYKFVESKKDWIDRHMKKIDQAKKDALFADLQDDQIPVYGQVYALIANPDLGGRYYIDAHTKIVRRGGGKVGVKTPLELLRFHAHAFLGHRLAMHAQQQSLEFNQTYIRSQKTKRGTCSTKKNIGLNRKLIMTPMRIQDYVIVHELCHLIHMNHSNDFRAELNGRFDRVDEARAWLKKHGGEIMSLEY